MRDTAGQLIGEFTSSYVSLRTSTIDRLRLYLKEHDKGSYDDAIVELLTSASGIREAEPPRGLIRHRGPWQYQIYCAECAYEENYRGQRATAEETLRRHWEAVHAEANTPDP